MTNRLYYGDNLEVLREHIADSSVDLIYLDPPFNSNASYNVLFRAPSGGPNGNKGTDASIEAFDDTWQWGPSAEDALADIRSSGNHKLHTLMAAIRTALGDNALMAYLAMMACGYRNCTACCATPAASTSTAIRPRATTSSWCWMRCSGQKNF